MLDFMLWIAQGVLALFFLFAGLPKITGRGLDRWVGFDEIPRPVTLLIGLCEVAGAVALVLPALVGGFEWTTPLAAVGIAVVSLLACGFHVRADETLPVLETALSAGIGVSIAVGRWNMLGTAPAISTDVLPPLLAVLVVAMVVNLVVLARSTSTPRTADR